MSVPTSEQIGIAKSNFIINIHLRNSELVSLKQRCLGQITQTTCSPKDAARRAVLSAPTEPFGLLPQISNSRPTRSALITKARKSPSMSMRPKDSSKVFPRFETRNSRSCGFRSSLGSETALRGNGEVSGVKEGERQFGKSSHFPQWTC